ncbi:hypothetical protein NET02_02885 [Thermomicrobiaceae bacterium CFH 74404]|mgnify:FL=1|uniref:Uncharacterized protein n=2 Tax=Thermomicrobia TaxID=189775 RepID=A0AA42B9D3_9BACT|nr:hypothetical protein [Thermalbibacter longus]MCM8748082.1 hypothetical protein [Thermalbibacter longus]
MAQEQAKRRSELISGVSNVAYDLLALLYNQLEEIAAIEEYKIDAEDAGDQDVLTLLDHIQQRAREDVDLLRSALSQRLA